MTASSFTCAACGGLFVQDWSDDEAAAEYAETFEGDVSQDDVDVVCDDCYKRMIADLPPAVFLAMAREN